MSLCALNLFHKFCDRATVCIVRGFRSGSDRYKLMITVVVFCWLAVQERENLWDTYLRCDEKLLAIE